MNELRIHTIADLRLHVCHCGKVFLDLTLDLALALALALDLALAQALDLALALASGSVFWLWLLDLALAQALAQALAFLMNEADKLRKGSVNEDDLYIAHNALVLMAAK